MYLHVCFSAAEYHYDIFSTYRFPIHQGVGGYVARTGKLLNITGAYDSEIFNPVVDEMTGYTTHTLLCAPLIVQGKYVRFNSVYMLMTLLSILIPRSCPVCSSILQVTESWAVDWE